MSRAESLGHLERGLTLSSAMRDRDAVVLGLLALGACCLPLVFGAYGLRVATMVALYVALAQSWNLVGGYTGLISLAQPAFYGSGAIAASILLINGAPVWLAVTGSLAVSLLIALVVGAPTLRLVGHYFVVATLLVSEALRNFVLNLNAFSFNGGISVNIISKVGLTGLSPAAYNQVFYYVMLALAAASMLVIFGLERSKWGLALRAIRDNQRAASALGVAATRLKIAVFLASAILTSLCGTAWAFWIGTVETNEAFSLTLTFEIIVMVFLGGRGTLWGPLLGVLVVLFINETIGIELAEITQVVSGVIVVLVVLLQPDGLIQIVRQGPRAFSPRTLAGNLQRYRVR